ncbi:O-methyltransferase [Mycolicibacter algericus]|uniref:O-methyltransferase n=1 Tax=Mycolicibacter algericus TaxID=1288388 RepID=A0A7I9YFJ0_MYCAL|nr:O-methyltransferase [Mycolicibacter algericus]
MDVTETPTPRDVDSLLDRIFAGDDPDLQAALAASEAAGLPSIAVSAQQGKFLNLLATATGATRILEIGTLGGYSTIWLARAVGPGGAVVTLEYEPTHADVARANLDRAGVGDRVQVIVGPALQTLPSLTGEPFDLVFIDADKENNVGYLDWAVRLCRPGSVIVVDNVIREGTILQPTSGDATARGSRDVLELMGEHPRLQAAAIQTVGAKGWDGFGIAVVA